MSIRRADNTPRNSTPSTVSSANSANNPQQTGRIGGYQASPGQRPPEKPSKPSWQVGLPQIPRIELPKIELPKIELPRICLPTLQLPRIPLPRIDLDITPPKIEPPRIDLDITLPKIKPPRIDLDITLPKITEPLRIDLPKIEPPRINLKTDSEKTELEIIHPRIVEPLRIDLPKIEPPRISLNITPPQIELPRINLNITPPKIEPPKIDLRVEMPTAREVYEMVDNIDKVLFPASFINPAAAAARDVIKGASEVVNAAAGKPLIPRNVNEAFIQDTKDFRNQIENVRNLQEEVRRLEASGAPSSEIQAAKARLAAASNQLQSSYGYTAETMPKPGQLWIDPQFVGGDLVNGGVTASKFPTNIQPITEPLSPQEFMFSPYGHPRQISVRNSDGSITSINNMQEYRALVAQNRAALGIPSNNGEPIAVHLALEGGGGLGKRYPAVFNEMYKLGIVPTSFSGTSAGAITAAFLAAGADPQQAYSIVSDPRLANLKDFNLRRPEGGAMDGKALYDFIDQKLRELTGITDRPVTFADLKAPLQIIAFRLNDTGMPQTSPEWSKPENRILVFSQETTPNMPVALAVRASASIPVAFDPVELIDPTTGRRMTVVDGGVYDNLPIGYNKNNLPTVAVNLAAQDPLSQLVSRPISGEAHPSNAKNPPPLPNHQLETGSLHQFVGTLWKTGEIFLSQNTGYREITSPPPNTFVLSVPTWDLTDPSRANTLLGFAYNDIDRGLDPQTAKVTREFFKQYLPEIGKPGASGTNLKPLPEKVSFDTNVRVGNTNYRALYYPGDHYVTFIDPRGNTELVVIGKETIEKMYLDHLVFGDLSSQLAHAYKTYPRHSESHFTSPDGHILMP
ncbi:MAG: patatin-like phospholipase family protein [Acidobacteriota bacterium]|nr:patatin-like phospholipase family protein [Blastocatellia bacterium]MDW8411121.1 patatin-like phospholipase family protein [Acidobacteriota bacterium]